MKKYVVTLLEEEREALGALTSKGKHRSQKILNALIFWGVMGRVSDGALDEEIARVLKISMRKIDRVKRRFVVDLEVCLNGTSEESGTLTHLVALVAVSRRKALRGGRVVGGPSRRARLIESVSHESRPPRSSSSPGGGRD